ncbi:MAG: hypothetical protein JWR85_1196 [Marmoricola sp.]|nr:hypothetical protein [Marmoricola sp.]
MTQPGSDQAPTTPNLEHWLGQDDLPWNILLVATLRETPPSAVLRERLAVLSATHGWVAPADDAVVEGEVEGLLEMFAALAEHHPPVSVGRTPTGLVIRAHHAYVDGLGLLAVLRALTGTGLTSRAAGIGDRPRRFSVGALVTRLAEVVVRPPAPVAGSAVQATSPGHLPDVFAATTVPRLVRTAELAHAAVQALSAWNAAAGARSDRIALAVGVSTVGGAELRVGDHSGFLRITGTERLNLAGLKQALADAPLQVGGTAQSSVAQRASGLIRWALRTFTSRLGSTVLVSHLGGVESEVLTGAAFYPLAGGGSGLALGAVTVSTGTTVTLRARGRQQSSRGLQRLLADVVDRLA